MSLMMIYDCGTTTIVFFYTLTCTSPTIPPFFPSPSVKGYVRRNSMQVVLLIPFYLQYWIWALVFGGVASSRYYRRHT